MALPLLGKIDLTAKNGNPYEHATCIRELVGGKVAVLVAVHNPATNVNHYELRIFDQFFTPANPDVTVVASGADDANSFDEWLNPLDMKYYLVVVCNQRDPITGYFHVVPKTFGPV